MFIFPLMLNGLRKSVSVHSPSFQVSWRTREYVNYGVCIVMMGLAIWQVLLGPSEPKS